MKLLLFATLLSSVYCVSFFSVVMEEWEEFKVSAGLFILEKILFIHNIFLYRFYMTRNIAVKLKKLSE